MPVKSSVFTAGAVLLFSFTAAVAQDYPSRAITYVVPYAAGGPVDTVARIFAQQLGDGLRVGVASAKNACP